MSIGTTIRYLRKEKGLSICKTFICQSRYSFFLEIRQNLPDIETLIKISKLFNATTEYIVQHKKTIRN